MLRRLHPEQPDSFAFTPANKAWAEAQITRYPEGRQASAVIPLLWRAQEQEGWLTRPAIECVADMLGMARIRALEVATFYFMFQLQPVGSVAHIQVCGTLSCMLCGSEDLVAVCRERIAPRPHALSGDGRFSWEEVECLGACTNAPMVQIGKDYYEDLTAARFGEILDELAAGRVPVPGPQNGRYAAEPLGGLTALTAQEEGRAAHNASVARAVELQDTIRRIDGGEVPLRAAWLGEGEAAMLERAGQPPQPEPVPDTPAADHDDRSRGRPVAEDGATRQEAPAEKAGTPEPEAPMTRPELHDSPPETADDLRAITGIGPKLEEALHEAGIHTYAQIAAWGPAEIAWIDEHVPGARGRVLRDDWAAQAGALMKKD
ncbi:NADH-quinone oxidoreductase subunit E [Mangrovicoccus algicola]|uniref:NADH-quinone oxidoreductase subunit E n=1 Tax=Mangrovicoccus algicola TaxID=2771008 RepID=A0A8J7D002_9RHOB|nr:NADH-quinone oxidoreductase subunit E [Mangrovicoccus algicola]MBE3638728.1 NADH-quinone oxidoreductase subunit E [Mangrovicoccus algicola]